MHRVLKSWLAEVGQPVGLKLTAVSPANDGQAAGLATTLET